MDNVVDAVSSVDSSNRGNPVAEAHPVSAARHRSSA